MNMPAPNSAWLLASALPSHSEERVAWSSPKVVAVVWFNALTRKEVHALVPADVFRETRRAKPVVRER